MEAREEVSFGAVRRETTQSSQSNRSFRSLPYLSKCNEKYSHYKNDIPIHSRNVTQTLKRVNVKKRRDEKKAAILQQTAQYIYDLENEKMKLLQQNSHLKRLLGEQEIASAASSIIQNNDEASIAAATITPTSIQVQSSGGLMKKRKLGDHIISMQTISDSSDEGLGSMSPEPVTLIASGGLSHAVTSKVQQTTIATPNNNNVSQQSVTKEVNQLRNALESELKNRTSLEDRIQQLERDMKRAQKQIYPTQYYTTQREIIDRDNLHHEEVSVVEIETLQQDENGQHVVLCSALEDLEEEEETEELREEVIISDESEMAQYVEVPPRLQPILEAARLQPILQAAIKAEPKVEVERITDDPNSPTSKNRVLLTSTSRQNLETIVEAIRHLEGDSLFDNVEQHKKKKQKQQQQMTTQDVPLALTTATNAATTTTIKPHQRKLKAELSPFIQLKKEQNGTTLKFLTTSNASSPVKVLTQSSSHLVKSGGGVQCRPGVIVGKQAQSSS
ncbi:TFAP4 family protein [Megaselia abdita]